MKDAKDQLAQWMASFESKDEGIENDKYVWAATDYSGWETMKIPGVWESAGLPGLDGVVWYQFSFTLPQEVANDVLTINLGPIDDDDITFLNGQEIGRTNGYSENREYSISPEFLKEGENNLVIRVVDYGGGGGLWGNPEQLFIKSGKFKASLAGEWKYKVGFGDKDHKPVGSDPNSFPTLLFNGMINPLIPYGIKGAIWYQGESNAGRAYQYRRLFADMIKDWRMHWGQGDFPFLWVQLANFMAPLSEPKDQDWAELREAQTMTLSLPNTGMALAIDLGDEKDIHPRNKQDVGKRLALSAYKVAYNEDVVYSGPMYKDMSVTDSKVKITFSHTGSGLVVKNKYGYINGFSIAGTDKKFYWAKAELLDDNTVVLWSDRVQKPVAVRYAWANNPDDANLYNKEELPAVPFRTDDWDGITKNNK